MAWLYVPALEGSNWASTSPSDVPTEPFVTLSGTHTQRPPSWRGWKTRPWIERLSGTTSRPSAASDGVESSISSLRVSRANRGRTLVPVEVRTTSDGSGPQSLESFARYDRESSSLRTCGDFFEEEWSTLSRTWPTSGSMRSGTCFRRPRWVPPTSESESSSSRWSSPNVADTYTDGLASSQQSEGSRHSETLAQQTARATETWSTPRATINIQNKKNLPSPKDGGRSSKPGLEDQAKHFWPTPALWPSPTTAGLDGGGEQSPSSEEAGSVADLGSPRRQQESRGTRGDEGEDAGRTENRADQSSSRDSVVAQPPGERLQGPEPLGIEHELGSRTVGFGVFPPNPNDLDRWARVLDEVPEAEPALCSVADGLASRLDESRRAYRSDQLRCVGNGVVPLAAATAFGTLMRRFT